MTKKKTDPRVEQLLTAIKACNRREVAAAWAQISDAELEQLCGDESIDAELRVAEAQVEVLLLMEIKNATATDWKAAAWIAERMFPERWGKPATGERRGENKPAASQTPDADEDSTADPLNGLRLVSGA